MAKRRLLSLILLVISGAITGNAATPAGAQEACLPPPGIQPPVQDPFLVFFDWNSSAITAGAAEVLDNVALAYVGPARCPILIAAHADRSGSSDYNLTLSRRRAEAVAAYLQRRGIASGFVLEGLGESRPLIETADCVREVHNRRAEIMLLVRYR